MGWALGCGLWAVDGLGENGGTACFPLRAPEQTSPVIDAEPGSMRPRSAIDDNVGPPLPETHIHPYVSTTWPKL